MVQQMLAIWSLVLLPFLNPAWTSGNSRFMYCWSLAWRILSITLLACEVSAIVWQKQMFFWNSCFFYDPTSVGNLISDFSAFSKSSLIIWKFTVHVLLKPGLENFEHYFVSMWDECNWAVVWAFFGIAFLWDWNENWPFPVLWLWLSFPNLLAYWTLIS